MKAGLRRGVCIDAIDRHGALEFVIQIQIGMGKPLKDESYRLGDYDALRLGYTSLRVIPHMTSILILSRVFHPRILTSKVEITRNIQNTEQVNYGRSGNALK